MVVFQVRAGAPWRARRVLWALRTSAAQVSAGRSAAEVVVAAAVVVGTGATDVEVVSTGTTVVGAAAVSS